MAAMVASQVSSSGLTEVAPSSNSIGIATDGSTLNASNSYSKSPGSEM